MKFIYFHIDERDRDLLVAKELSRLFKEKNVKVFFGTRKTHKILNFFEWVFDVIIFPRPHFLSGYYGSKFNNWKCKIVCLPTENIGSILINKFFFAKTALDLNYFDPKIKDRLPDLQFLWGSKQLKALKDTVPSETNRFYVSGHPRYHSLGNIQFKPRRSKPNIIFLSRSTGLNDYLLRNPLELLMNTSRQFVDKVHGNIKHPSNTIDKSGKTYTDSIMLAEIVDFISLMDNIRMIIKNRKKFGQVVIRPHPKENIKFWNKFSKQYGNSILIDNLSLNLVKTFQKFDFCITPPSTSLYDCVRVGCIPISNELMSKDRPIFKGMWNENNIKLNNITKKPKSPEELLSILLNKNNEIDLNQIKKILKEECNYPEDQNSIKKIVDILHDKFLINIPFSFKKMIVFKGLIIMKFLFVKLYFKFKQAPSSSDIIAENCEF